MPDAEPDIERPVLQLRPDEPRHPQPLDLARLSAMPVPARVHRVGTIMPIGTIGVISAHGGMGKSQLALDACIAIADGADFLGMDTLTAICGFVSEEDDENDCHFRIAAQCRHRGTSMADVANRLFVYPATEESGAPLVSRARDGLVAPTDRYMKLRAELIRRNVEFLVLDNLAALCAVDINSPSEATQAMALLNVLVPIEGNVVLIAHVDKATAKAGYGAQGYSGTAAWHNRARWRWYLFAPDRGDDATDPEQQPARDDGRRILEVQKVNAGTWGQRIALRLGADGVVMHDGVEDGIVASIRVRADRRWLLDHLKAAEDAGDPVHSNERANLNAYRRLAAIEGFPPAFRGKRGKRALFDMLQRMKADGSIEERGHVTTSRNKVTAWHLTDDGRFGRDGP